MSDLGFPEAGTVSACRHVLPVRPRANEFGRTDADEEAGERLMPAEEEHVDEEFAGGEGEWV